MIEIILINFL